MSLLMDTLAIMSMLLMGIVHLYKYMLFYRRDVQNLKYHKKNSSQNIRNYLLLFIFSFTFSVYSIESNFTVAMVSSLALVLISTISIMYFYLYSSNRSKILKYFFAILLTLSCVYLMIYSFDYETRTKTEMTLFNFFLIIFFASPLNNLVDSHIIIREIS